MFNLANRGAECARWSELVIFAQHAFVNNKIFY